MEETKEATASKPDLAVSVMQTELTEASKASLTFAGGFTVQKIYEW